MKKLPFLMLPLISLWVGAQNEDSVFIKRISDQILRNGKAYDDLRVLTKQIGGRLSGSTGMYKAEVWGLQAMKGANADNAWLQECKVPHWVRGGKDAAIATYGKKERKPLDILALGNSVGTGAVGLTAPVVQVKIGRAHV